MDMKDQITLHDSETAQELTARDLGITRQEYAAAIRDSLASDEAEGHIIVAGRRVYAQ
jgi:hypothetical protein